VWFSQGLAKAVSLPAGEDEDEKHFAAMDYR
jgi:hypothetical protein